MPTYTWKRGQSEPGGGGDSYEWTETWIVLGYVQQDGEVGWIELLADQPTLAKGQAHPVVPGAYVDDFQADRIGTSEGWEAKVRYKIEPNEEPDISPLLRAAEVEVDSESEPLPVLKWANGDPILNTAGDLIFGETRDEPRVLLSVTKNVASTPSWVYQYAGKINSDTVTIDGAEFAPYTLRCKQIRRGKRESELIAGATVYYYPLTFSLIHKEETWERKILNRGFYARRTDSSATTGSPAGSKYRIKIDGENVDEPQFLNEDGEWLDDPEPEDIITVDGYVDGQLPFSALPLT